MMRVWYEGGRTFDVSTLREWKALPDDGFLWAAVVKETGVTHYSGGDWYWVENERLRYTPAAPWGSHSPHPGGCVDCVKRGAGVSDSQFERVADDAREWGRTQWEALRAY
jgi:hypothetical protein